MRHNNFNLLRMIAACAVIVSHSFPLSYGIGSEEPIVKLTKMFSLGGLAVQAFFAISGLFILQSFYRRKSNLDFLAARFLRIVPGLAVMGVVVALGIGPAVSTADDYLTSSHTWLYSPRVASILFTPRTLPGVFEDNPFPLTVNGSLWTLYFEVVCYAALFVSGITGLLQRR